MCINCYVHVRHAQRHVNSPVSLSFSGHYDVHMRHAQRHVDSPVSLSFSGNYDVHVRHAQRHVDSPVSLSFSGHYDVHVRHAQRHGHTSLPVPSQDVYNPPSPREEQPRSLHHIQEHSMSHRESCCVRDLHQELQLILQRRVSQVSLLKAYFSRFD